MLSDETLLLSLRGLSRAGQKGPILLILSQLNQPATIAKIKEKGRGVGFREIEKWNIAQPLLVAAKGGLVAQLPQGWKLLGPGYSIIEQYFKPEAAIIRETRHSLRQHLATIASDQRRSFVEEAIRAFDVKAFRASVVLSWVGAAHILQEWVVADHLTAFNSAISAKAAKAASGGKNYPLIPIKTQKEFGTITESEFLQLCQDAGILHKSEKKILSERLDLRNQCGHPNPILIAEHVVASHIEILMLNVYSKY